MQNPPEALELLGDLVDSLEIRCPGAKAPGKELASSSRCQGTVHRTVPLNFSNLRVYHKREIPSGISLFW